MDMTGLLMSNPSPLNLCMAGIRIFSKPKERALLIEASASCMEHGDCRVEMSEIWSCVLCNVIM